MNPLEDPQLLKGMTVISPEEVECRLNVYSHYNSLRATVPYSLARCLAAVAEKSEANREFTRIVGCVKITK